MPFTVSDESGNMTGERVITAALDQWKLGRSCGDAFMANIRRRRHIAGGSTHSFNLLDEELSKFVGVDVARAFVT